MVYFQWLQHQAEGIANVWKSSFIIPQNETEIIWGKVDKKSFNITDKLHITFRLDVKQEFYFFLMRGEFVLAVFLQKFLSTFICPMGNPP